MSHAENHCLRRHADYRICQRQIMTELDGQVSAEDKIKKESDAISTNFTGFLKTWGGPESVVRIGTSYGLVGPGFEPQWGSDFRTHPVRTEARIAAVQVVLGLFARLKFPGCSADHSSPF
jgi:hypothetical protein